MTTPETAPNGDQDRVTDSAARRTRPSNAYEALRDRGWHDSGGVRFCHWNNVRLFVTDHGDTMLDKPKNRGGRWVVQFPADVPLHVIVAAAEAAAGRPADA